jgi:cytoskeletal protein RodZ
MNLEQFGEELKQARLKIELSLVDISAETRISIKFLDAIECGQLQILPQTYVRAFLREYALMTRLDPDDVLRRYEAARKESSSRISDEAALQQISLQEKTPVDDSKKKPFSLSLLQRNTAFGLFIVTAVVIVAILAHMNKNSSSGISVEEVPFDRVVRESEAASIPRPVAAADSASAAFPAHPDSLRLEMSTQDSVWINILIDGRIGKTYLFGANRNRVWVAKERFVITMGNAGGATFHLNGKDIGALGKPGAVVRNTIISAADLKN